LSDDGDAADAVATSSEDSEKRDAAAADTENSSSLMLAENMEAQEPEQKLRAKRDLDADDIRELFESQRAPVDDYSVPGILLNFRLIDVFVNLVCHISASLPTFYASRTIVVVLRPQ